jgi:hypothetical protein
MSFIQNVKEKFIPTEEKKRERIQAEMKRIEQETEHLKQQNAAKKIQVEALEAKKREQDYRLELKERERKSSKYYQPKQKIKESIIKVAKNAGSQTTNQIPTPQTSRKTKSRTPQKHTKKGTRTKSGKTQTNPAPSFSSWGDIGFNTDLYTGPQTQKKKKQKQNQDYKIF